MVKKEPYAQGVLDSWMILLTTLLLEKYTSMQRPSAHALPNSQYVVLSSVHEVRPLEVSRAGTHIDVISKSMYPRNEGIKSAVCMYISERE